MNDTVDRGDGGSIHQGFRIAIELPSTGDVFEGRYELIEVLGRGGFATVYLATDTVMSRDVAIKILSPTEGEYLETVAARFLRESKVFASLEDPHTITMYDFGDADGLLYMVFEYVQGQDLADIVKERGALSPRVVAHIVAQLLSALREAHDRGIFHRDIKPANVLIHEYGGDPYCVKLIDFGIAKDASPDAASITRTGRVVGTPRYMAPEQLFGQPMGPESDLYSLGLLAFEMLIGRPAVDGTTNKDVLRQQVSDVSIVVPEHRAPRELRRVIERMTAKDRRARYQAAGDVLRDLREAQRTLPDTVSTISTETDTSVPDDLDTIVDAPALQARRPTESAEASAPEESLRWQRVALVALTVLGVGGVAAWWAAPEPPPDRTAPRRADVVKLLGKTEAPTAPAVVAEPEAAPDVGPPKIVPDHGCGKEPKFDGTGRMAYAIGRRDWIAHLPSSYSKDVPHPLLMMFHRNWANAGQMMAETAMIEAAEQHGIVVFSFESGESLPWQGRGDIEHVLRAIDYAHRELCLDPTRIYALGEGQGSELVQRLACTVPLSAIASSGYAPHQGEAICEPRTATPRLRVYGKLDRHVPAAGGKGCIPLANAFHSAEQINEHWTGHNECSGKERSWNKQPGGKCITWDCKVAPYVSCETDGGHFWPGAKPPPIDLDSCQVRPARPPFPYRDVVVQFFLEEGRALDPADYESYR